MNAAYIEACVWVPSHMPNVPVRKAEERTCETKVKKETKVNRVFNINLRSKHTLNPDGSFVTCKY